MLYEHVWIRVSLLHSARPTNRGTGTGRAVKPVRRGAWQGSSYAGFTRIRTRGAEVELPTIFPNVQSRQNDFTGNCRTSRKASDKAKDGLRIPVKFGVLGYADRGARGLGEDVVLVRKTRREEAQTFEFRIGTAIKLNLRTRREGRETCCFDCVTALRQHIGNRRKGGPHQGQQQHQ